MVFLQCSRCQTKSTVDESFIGRQVRCPGCSGVMTVPEPAADRKQGKFKGYTRKWIGIVFGLVLLGTMAIPVWWYGADSGPEYFYRILGGIWKMPASAQRAWALAGIYGIWAAGAVALLSGLFLRRMLLAVGLSVAGGGLMTLMIGARLAELGEPALPSLFGFSGWAAAGAAAVAAASLMLNNLRRKLGGKVWVCLLQILAAAGLVTVMTTAMMDLLPAAQRRMEEFRDESEARVIEARQFAQAADVPAQGQQEALRKIGTDVTAEAIVAYHPVFLAAAMGLSGLLAAVHGITFGKKSRSLSVVANWIAIGTFALSYKIPIVVRSVAGQLESDVALQDILKSLTLFAPGIVIIWATIVLVLEALPGLLADLLGKAGVRPAGYDAEAEGDAEPIQVQTRPAGQPPASRSAIRPAAGASSARQGAGLTPGQRLDRLKALLDEGTISEEEYAAKREEILKEL